jgi:hypothetical protein
MWTRLRALASRVSYVLARRRLDEDLRLDSSATHCFCGKTSAR